MKAYIKELNRVFTVHPYREKILIVDSHSFGDEIIKGYVQAGHPSIHLQAKTVLELAQEVVDVYSTNSCQLLEQAVGNQLIYSLLNSLKNQQVFTYFTDVEVSPTFSQAIYQTMKKLRLAGYTKDSLDKTCFISSRKSEDLYVILSHYEELLTANHWYDEAALLTEAVKHTHKINDDAVFILQSNLALTQLEEHFLERIARSFYKLPLATVCGSFVPNRSSLQSIKFAEAKPLSYLYDLDHSLEKAELSLFTAKTVEVEVKHVFEQIKETVSRLDDTVIFYTNMDPYVTMIYHLAERLNIPVTYGEGLPVTFSRPGKLISGFINWLKTNYSVQAFLEMLHEGVLHLGEGSPSKTKVTKLLREAQIGRDPNRYITQLEQEIKRATEKLSATDEEETVNYYKKKVADLRWLKQWFSRLFKKLPALSIQLNYKELLQAIQFLIKDLSNTVSALDEIAKTTIIEEVERIIPFADEELSAYEALEKIVDALLSIRVLQSGSKPGHIHITSYKKGIYHNQRYIYIVGLDNQSFPGQLNEDPLLLDDERLRLGNGLPLRKEYGRINTYTMLQLLAETEGTVSLSYCNFDIHGNRDTSPSHLFLQAFRFKTRDKNATFKDLKKMVSVLSPNEALEEKDFWADLLNSSGLEKVDMAFISRHFVNIMHGMNAHHSRKSEKFSVFDGNITFDEHHYYEQIKKLSAGKLERLAKCPYSYFLQDVLKVQPIEVLSYNANTWLDAATRGSLLHKIFELFYKKLQDGNEKPALLLHEESIVSIALDLIEKQKTVLPPPNEHVFEREVEDILHCCKIFLKEEEDYCKDYQPLHFEYGFGINNQEPAVISLSSGAEINIAGIVDRVDQSKDGNYHIIDYKTGSTFDYNDQTPFKGGRQLQHFIYAIAIEQHLQLEQGAVLESSYYFPSSKGLGERYVRRQDETLRTRGMDILENLIEVLRKGHFVMTDDESDCKFCQYRTVCRRDFYDNQYLEQKHADEEAPGHDHFKGVRRHD